MAACSLITANIIIDCSRPPVPGTGDTLYIFNRDEIAGYTLNGTNDQIIAAILMVTDKKGFKLQGNRSSVEPSQSLDVQRFFKGYIHLIDAKVFNADPATKIQIELMRGGKFVCVVEYKNKGTNGDSMFELYGYDVGLEVTVTERKPTDLETGGGYNLQFKTPENSRESNLPKALWITSEAVTSAALAGVISTGAPPPPVILIPIWGQSNASGHLTSAAELPGYGVGAMANVKIWNWMIGTPAWQDLQVGVNNNRNDGVELNADKFGPEVELGYRMQQLFGGTIYLVKVSKYASPFYPGGLNVWDAATVGGLTDQFIATIIAARDNLIAAGKTVSIKALYGMQGEGDGDSMPHATAWPASKLAFYNKVKAALGLSSLMDVFGRSRYAIGASSIELRAQQTAYAAADPATRFMVDTDGYATADGTHYTGVWQIKQGLDAYNIIKNFYP